MKTQDFKNLAKTNLSSRSTSDLIAEVKKLANDFSNGASLVSEVALEILMERMPESEFVALCNEL